MNIEITLDKRLLDNADSDFFHWDYGYELAKCEYGTFYIASRGDMRCAYIDKENDIYREDYIDIIRYHIKNNADYEKAVDEGKLVFDLNNWFEIEFYTKDNGEYVCLTDDIFGSITECLMAFKEYIKDEDIMKEFEEDIKEVLKNE